MPTSCQLLGFRSLRFEVKCLELWVQHYNVLELIGKSMVHDAARDFLGISFGKITTTPKVVATINSFVNS